MSTFGAGGDDDIVVEARVDIDNQNLDSELRRSFQRIVSGLDQVENGFATMSRRMTETFQRTQREARSAARSIDSAFGRLDSQGLSIGGNLIEGLNRAGQAADAFGRRSTESAREGGVAFRELSARLETLDTSFRELNTRAQRLGLSGAQLAPLKDGLGDIARLQDRLNREVREYGSATEATLTETRRQYELTSRSLGVQQQIIAELSADQRIDAARTASILKNQAIGAQQQITNAVRAEGKTRAIEAQRQAQLEIGAARVAGQQRVQITRFFLESAGRAQRVFTDTLRQTLTTTGRLINSIGNGVSQGFANVFRRGARSINDNSVFVERRLRNTFRRQENITLNSMNRQTAIIERARAQQQRGLAGLATRSGLFTGALTVGGGFVVARQLREGFEESVNLNESLNKTGEIFGDVTDDVVAFSENSVRQLFITQSAALEAAANFGIFGKSAGLAGDELTQFSTDLVLLATDLASFNNTSVEDAITAISAALRGEQEPIRRYGVLLDQATLKQTALENGIIDTIDGALTPQQRVLAANIEIFKQTADQQGDAARTADGFANSSRRLGAAVDTFFARATQRLVPFAEAFTNSALPAVEALTAVISGGEGLNPVLREATILVGGFAAGVATLLVAKAAGEALQFMALGVRALLTPFGGVILAAGLLGSAIAFIASRSGDFREAVGDLRSAFGQLLTELGFVGREIVEFVSPVIERFGNFLTGTVAPAVARVARAIADNLVSGLRTGIGFLRNEVQPRIAAVIEAFVGFGREQLPRVINAVRAAATTVGRLAAGVARSVRPFVEPIVGLFAGIGTAIINLVRGEGSFEDLRTAFTEGISGIAASFGPLLASIGDRLVGFGSDIVSRVQSLFTAANFSTLLDGISEVAFQITNVLTDPRLIALVVAAGVTLGFALGRGIIRGLLNNFRQGLDLLQQIELPVADALVDAFLEAAKRAAPLILAGIAALLAAGFTGTSLRGISSSLSRALVSASQFSSTLFARGGAATVRSNLDARALADQQRSLEGANRALRAYGSVTVTAGEGAKGLAAANEAATARVKALTKELGPARAGALRLRSSLGQLGAASRSFGADLGRGFRGVEGGVSGSFDRLRTGITNSLATLRANGVARARSTGRAIGGAVAGGVGAALSGVQLGSARSAVDGLIGGLGLLSSALVAFQLGGPAAAGVTLGIGAITTALTASKRSAQETAEEIATWESVVTTAIRNAREEADGGPIELPAVVSGLGGDFGDTLADELKKESDEVRNIIAEAVRGGAQGLDFLGEALAEGLASGDLAAARRRVSEYVSEILPGFREELSLGVSAESQRLAALPATDLTAVIVDAVFSGRTDSSNAILGAVVGDYSETLDFFRDEIGELTEGNADALRDDLTRTGEDLASSGYAPLDWLRGYVEQLKAEAEGTDFGSVAPAVAVGLSESLSSASPINVGVPVDLEAEFRIEQQSTQEAANSAIRGLKLEADELTRSYESALAAYERLLNPDQSSLPQELARSASALESASFSLPEFDTSTITGRINFDAGVADVQDQLSRAVRTAVEDGLDIDDVGADLQGLIDETFAGDNEIDVELRGIFSENLATLLNEGVPILDVALDEQALEAAISNASTIFEEADDKFAARLVLEDDELVTAIDAIQQISPEVVGRLTILDDPNDRAAQISELIGEFEAGFNSDQGFAWDPNISVESNLLRQAGIEAARGFAAGIDSPEGRRAVDTAAGRLAGRARVAVTRNLAIQSPSRVFRGYGLNVAQGFALGMNDGQTLVRAGSEGMAGWVVDPIRHVVPEARDAGREIGAGVTEGVLEGLDDFATAVREAVDPVLVGVLGPGASRAGSFGSGLAALLGGLPIGGQSLEAQLAAVYAGFGTTLTEGGLEFGARNRDQIDEIRRRLEEDPDANLSELERTILRLDGDPGDEFTLDDRSVFGRRNQAEIAGLVAQITGAAAQIAEAGGDADDVSGVLADGRRFLIESLVRAGGDREEIEEFLAELGLSTEAIRQFVEAADDLAEETRRRQREIEEERAADEAEAVEEAVELYFSRLPRPGDAIGQVSGPNGQSPNITIVTQGLSAREVEAQLGFDYFGRANVVGVRA